MMTRAIAVLLALTIQAVSAGAQTLTADLSSHVIGITTGFVGATLVLFGTTADLPGAPPGAPPDDIIVVIRGTPSDILVRRKERIAGVWINGSSALFHDAPGFYAVAATRPPAQITNPATLGRHAIGIDTLRLPVAGKMTEADLAVFRAALIDSREKAGLYRQKVTPVVFQGEYLFRADVSFPANMPTGSYSVETFLFSSGQLISAQTTPLVVSRVGFSNGVFVLAHRHAALYGAGALAFAAAAGWAAGAAFRRV